MSTDAWRRRFPTAELLDVVDAFADLVAERCAEKLGAVGERPTIERAGLSPREAAEYLGLGESTVRRHIESGEIKAARLGDRIIIHRAELDRLLLGEQVAS